MRKLSGFATMLALGIALAPAAFAGDASTQAAAEALFREGRALMQQGKYPEACQKLKESQRLDPGAGDASEPRRLLRKGGPDCQRLGDLQRGCGVGGPVRVARIGKPPRANGLISSSQPCRL